MYQVTLLRVLFPDRNIEVTMRTHYLPQLHHVPFLSRWFLHAPNRAPNYRLCSLGNYFLLGSALLFPSTMSLSLPTFNGWPGKLLHQSLSMLRAFWRACKRFRHRGSRASRCGTDINISTMYRWQNVSWGKKKCIILCINKPQFVLHADPCEHCPLLALTQL